MTKVTLNPKQKFKLKMEACKLFPYDFSRLIISLPIDVQQIENELEDFIIKVVYPKNTIVFSSNTLQECSFEEILSIFMHSVLYVFFRHEKRGKRYHGNDKYKKLIWLIASEWARTTLLHGWNLPYGNVFKLPPEEAPAQGSVEIYYEWIEQFISKMQQEGNLGIGGDGYGIPFNAPGLISEDESEEEWKAEDSTESYASSPNSEYKAIDESWTEENLETEAAIHDAIKNIAKNFNHWGNMHIHGEMNYLRHFYNPEKSDLVKRLRNLLVSLCGAGPGKWGPSSRPRRKQLSGDLCINEDKRRGYKKVAAIVDVSGSLHEYRQEVFDALGLSLKATTRLDVFIGDTVVMDKYKNIKKLEGRILGLPEGGGTDMGRIMEDVDKEDRYYAMVVITDALTPWPREPTRAKAYVMLIGEHAVQEIPEWITKV